VSQLGPPPDHEILGSKLDFEYLIKRVTLDHWKKCLYMPEVRAALYEDRILRQKRHRMAKREISKLLTPCTSPRRALDPAAEYPFASARPDASPVGTPRSVARPQRGFKRQATASSRQLATTVSNVGSTGRLPTGPTPPGSFQPVAQLSGALSLSMRSHAPEPPPPPPPPPSVPHHAPASPTSAFLSPRSAVRQMTPFQRSVEEDFGLAVGSAEYQARLMVLEAAAMRGLDFSRHDGPPGSPRPDKLRIVIVPRRRRRRRKMLKPGQQRGSKPGHGKGNRKGHGRGGGFQLPGSSQVSELRPTMTASLPAMTTRLQGLMRPLRSRSGFKTPRPKPPSSSARAPPSSVTAARTFQQLFRIYTHRPSRPRQQQGPSGPLAPDGQRRQGSLSGGLLACPPAVTVQGTKAELAVKVGERLRDIRRTMAQWLPPVVGLFRPTRPPGPRPTETGGRGPAPATAARRVSAVSLLATGGGGGERRGSSVRRASMSDEAVLSGGRSQYGKTLRFA
jgi:hypothetical protein